MGMSTYTKLRTRMTFSSQLAILQNFYNKKIKYMSKSIRLLDGMTLETGYRVDELYVNLRVLVGLLDTEEGRMKAQDWVNTIKHILKEKDNE